MGWIERAEARAVLGIIGIISEETGEPSTHQASENSRKILGAVRRRAGLRDKDYKLDVSPDFLSETLSALPRGAGFAPRENYMRTDRT